MYLSAQWLCDLVVVLEDRAHRHPSELHTCAPFRGFFSPQLGRYTKDGQLFLGPLGSTGEDTHCVVDDPISSVPQLLNCDRVTNVKQMTWHFSQVRAILASKPWTTRPLLANPSVSRVSPCSPERVHHQPGHGPMSGGGAGQRLLWPPADPAALHWPKVDHQEHNEAVIRGTIFHEEL